MSAKYYVPPMERAFRESQQRRLRVVKPHIRRYKMPNGIWVWGMWKRGVDWALVSKPDYYCTQLSIVKDVQRGLALQPDL